MGVRWLSRQCKCGAFDTSDSVCSAATIMMSARIACGKSPSLFGGLSDASNSTAEPSCGVAVPDRIALTCKQYFSKLDESPTRTIPNPRSSCQLRMVPIYCAFWKAHQDRCGASREIGDRMGVDEDLSFDGFGNANSNHAIWLRYSELRRQEWQSNLCFIKKLL
jgi:hypothetical protein